MGRVDRRVPVVAVAVILGAVVGAAVLAPGDRAVVSTDPGLEAFTVEEPGREPVPVAARTVGPWRVERGYVFPEEGFAPLDRDALLLIPGEIWPAGTPAWIQQRTTLPGTENATVRLVARNAAVLAGVPVTYSDRYCAASNVTVSVTAPDREVAVQASRTIGHRQEEIVVDATRFAGGPITITATVRPADTGCGTARSTAAHLSFFGVETAP